uniref:hypothetical protein n=1 Tax=Salmonella sp. s51228 TaxID=3159652 RepID=UPI00397E95DD
MQIDEYQKELNNVTNELAREKEKNEVLMEINKQRRQIHSLNSELNQYRYTTRTHSNSNTSQIALRMQIDEYQKEL